MAYLPGEGYMQNYTVDLASLSAGKDFITSLQCNGFAIIKNPPISIRSLQNLYECWREFFASSHKSDYAYDNKNLDGYFPFGLEKPKAGKRYADLKEYFYFYPWGKCPSDLREETLSLHTSLHNLGTMLLEWIEWSLPADIKTQLSMPLAQMVNPTKRDVLRILHYPTISNLFNGDNKAELRAAEHEDLTLLTLINTSIDPGLQLKSSSQEWLDCNTGFNSFVVNIGDMLSMCTKGYYKATTHRVTLPQNSSENKSRYAMAYFLNPRDDVKLDEIHTAETCMLEHVRKKLAAA
jgi:isopenicillin N synthase-like dioxygenase